MTSKYGESFDKAYVTVKKNKLLMLEENGEAKLDDLVSDCMPDAAERKQFLKIVTGYTIMHGMHL